MKIYIADEASPTVSRYKHVGLVDFGVRLLLTANGNAQGRARIIHKACHALHPLSLFVDSGAFIYSSAFYKHGTKLPIHQAEQYLRDHLGACFWLAQNGYPIKAVAELDMQPLYGQYTIEKWRNEYMLPFQEQTGVNVVFGWHGDEDFDALISKPWCNYVGISMGYGVKYIKDQWGTMENFYTDMREMIDACYEEKVRIHGYAVTRTPALKKLPFYSVDSVSWQQSLHFGGVIAFDRNTGNLVRADLGRGFVKRKGLKAAALNLTKLQAFGCRLSLLDILGRKNAEGKIRPDNVAIFKDQARVFSDMEQWFTAYWKQKGIDWAEQLGEEEDTPWGVDRRQITPPRAGVKSSWLSPRRKRRRLAGV